MPTGKVERVLQEKGFGFIKPDSGDKSDIFFHVTALTADRGQRQNDVFAAIAPGQKVSYDKEDGPKGPRAANVRVL